MIIGFLFTIKGAFNILKGLNYFIFKDNFKMIPMELTSVYKSLLVFMKLRIYIVINLFIKERM